MVRGLIQGLNKHFHDRQCSPIRSLNDRHSRVFLTRWEDACTCKGSSVVSCAHAAYRDIIVLTSTKRHPDSLTDLAASNVHDLQSVRTQYIWIHRQTARPSRATRLGRFEVNHIQIIVLLRDRAVCLMVVLPVIRV